MGEKISGHLELLYPSPYLKAADLAGRECTVTISHLEWDDIPQAGKSETVRKPVVFLLGADGKMLKKKLAAGATIARQIGDALGEKDAGKWGGKRITIYGTTTKGKGGKTVECVRVRARVANEPSDPGGPTP